MPTEFKISMSFGASTVEATRSPSAAAMLQFVDDLIPTFGEVDDGAGGERPMTRLEAAQEFVNDEISKVKSRSRNLARDRLARPARGIDD